MFEKLKDFTSQDIATFVEGEIVKFPTTFQEKYKTKITFLSNMSKRQNTSLDIKKVIARELTSLEKLAVKETAPQKLEDLSLTEKIEQITAALRKDGGKLNGTTKEEVLSYVEDITNSILDQDADNGLYVAFELIEVLVSPPKDFGSIVELIGKFPKDEKRDLRESMLLLADIAVGNFEYFDYKKWQKLTSDKIADVRLDTSSLMKIALKKIQEILSKEINKEKQQLFRSEIIAKAVDVTWVPVKRILKERQEADDLVLARSYMVESLMYYLEIAGKETKELESLQDSKKREEVRIAIERNLFTFSQVLLANSEVTDFLCGSQYYRDLLLRNLNELQPFSQHALTVFLTKIVNSSHVPNSVGDYINVDILWSVRKVPGAISLLLNNSNNTIKERIFLYQLVFNFFSYVELRRLPPEEIRNYVGDETKLSLLRYFDAIDGKKFLNNLYDRDRKKFNAIMTAPALYCLSANLIDATQFKGWSSTEICDITNILSDLKLATQSDAKVAIGIYHSSGKRDWLFTPNVKEALSRNNCTLEAIAKIKSSERFYGLFSNNALRGYRLKLFTFEELSNLTNSNDIKSLTHSNAIATMRDNKIKFEQLFRVLKDNSAKFFFLTSVEARLAYTKGVSFEQRLKEYDNKKPVKYMADRYGRKEAAGKGISK